jgi:hypothetical protein
MDIAHIGDIQFDKVWYFQEGDLFLRTYARTIYAHIDENTHLGREEG